LFGTNITFPLTTKPSYKLGQQQVPEKTSFLESNKPVIEKVML